jgi:Tol biopolymer transport system component
MPLHAGARLGPYEIQSPIGAGGMGEVYRARDTRLDRSVAIKVLSSELAADVEFRVRFAREARTLSHLNHRHVCTLYDVGEADGTAFLVMEYLEGETLAARLARVTFGGGTLPLAEAMRTGAEIASALDAAHRVGITHRDLKPGNVMLTRAGVKLLDFGLAKASGDAVAPTNPDVETRRSASPGATAPLTGQGHIVGTLQYMAPEQIEGRAADARTDVFAFGAVMYEMVVGRPPFGASSAAGLIGSILKDEPAQPSSVRPALSPALDFLIRRCLAKDPDERWQSARDLKSQLEWIAESLTPAGPTSGVTPAPKAGSAPRNSRRAWLAGGALLIAAVLAGAVLWPRTESGGGVTAPDVRFHITVPPMPPPGFVAISPDGRQVAFVARKPGASDVGLWVRPLDATAARLVPDTDDAYSPFWSPDSRTIAFGSRGQLRRVGVDGLPAVTICTVPAPHDFSGGSWNRDGTIVFSAGGGLLRVRADGGDPVAITRLDASRGESNHYFPWFLPDGRRFLFLARSGDPAHTGVYVGSLDAPETTAPTARQKVVEASSMALFAAPGHVIYQHAGVLMAVPVNERSLQVTGPPVRLAEGISFSIGGRGAFSVAENGTLVYRTGESDPITQLTWFDRKGQPVATVGPPTSVRQLVLSPDGKRVAIDRRDPAIGTYDIWILELTNGVLTRLTFGPSEDADPTWAPDSQSIAFWSNREKPGIYVRRLGTEQDQRVLEAEQAFLMHWAADGELLFHNRLTISGLMVGKGGAPTLLFKSPFGKDEAHVSVEGKWVAYNSMESGKLEVHVASYPAFQQRRQVSSGGGGAAWWRADGRELFYLSVDGKLMSVPVTPGPAPEFGTPTALFQSPLTTPNLDMDEYAVSADGQRFLMMHRADTSTTPITVVMDWRKLMK